VLEYSLVHSGRTCSGDGVLSNSGVVVCAIAAIEPKLSKGPSNKVPCMRRIFIVPHPIFLNSFLCRNAYFGLKPRIVSRCSHDIHSREARNKNLNIAATL
jgi:hypothetical protein